MNSSQPTRCRMEDDKEEEEEEEEEVVDKLLMHYHPSSMITGTSVGDITKTNANTAASNNSGSNHLLNHKRQRFTPPANSIAALTISITTTSSSISSNSAAAAAAGSSGSGGTHNTSSISGSISSSSGSSISSISSGHNSIHNNSSINSSKYNVITQHYANAFGFQILPWELWFMLCSYLGPCELSYLGRTAKWVRDMVSTITKLDFRKVRAKNRVYDNCMTWTVNTFPLLHEVNITGCNKLTNAALDILSLLPSLSCLQLAYCRGITEEGLKSFALRNPNLNSLSIDTCQGVQSLIFLNYFKKLTHLSMLHWQSELSEDVICQCVPLKTLLHLNLFDCKQLTDETLDALLLALCSDNLHALDISFIYNLTDKVCTTLMRYKKLHSLRMLGLYGITETGLKQIRHLEELESWYK